MVRITSVIIIAAILLLVVWDIWVASNDVPGDTISEIILKWSRRWPILAFAAGVLAGHLFWPQR